MCGICAVKGKDCLSRALDMLGTLEYRGYDSVGVGVKTDNGLQVFKTVGRCKNLNNVLPNLQQIVSVIGHTRWATHGKVSERNAHPFVSYKGNFVIVHNGVLDNWQTLKRQLVKQGVEFLSETDSEVIAHLLEYNYNGDVFATVCAVAKSLVGSFAVVVQTTFDNKLYLVKHGSPLVVANCCGDVVCSDVRCLPVGVSSAVVVAENSVCVVDGGVQQFDFDGNSLPLEWVSVSNGSVKVADGDMMLSEIMEIPQRIRQAKQHYVDSGGLSLSAKRVKRLKRIYCVGCGTAFHSGLATAAVARKFVDIDVVAVTASEFLFDNYPVDEDTLALCVSQSGETADTIVAAKQISAKGGIVCAVTNTMDSAITRVADFSVDVCAGAEFAVASTKAYNCQLVTLVLLLADVALVRKSVPTCFKQQLLASIDKSANAVARVLQQSDSITEVAKEICKSSAVYFVGHVVDLPTAMEGALKMQEISYLHCQAFAAGELKHGPLALMENGVSVVCVATELRLAQALKTTVCEAETRGATAWSISPYKVGKRSICVCPIVGQFASGIVSVVPLQLLAYHVAKQLGRDVDKPRNLAKSVTVH